MPRDRLSLQALPAWMGFNNAIFRHVEVKPIQHKGNGLRAQADSSTIGQSPIIQIPHELVLNKEAVEQYAKSDWSFRALWDACGHKSPRHDILLFLLAQLVLTSRPADRVAISNPWTEYVKMLDDDVPLPTLWTEHDRNLLQGTSLEPALHAKLSALSREVDDLRETSSALVSWNSALWEQNTVCLADWALVDAWYRSRVLELPHSGPSLVPCIDMANHATAANAHYEETPDGDVVLLLREGSAVSEGDEVTISYGSDKSAAEMLFSYGFLDAASAVQSLTLPIRPFPDDPLGKAKAHVYTDTTTVQLQMVGEVVEWTSPFAHLLCLNEEDGLEFKVLRSSDAGRELRVFWQEEDVTDEVKEFERLIGGHELSDVFRLRANMVVSQRLQEQLDRLFSPNSVESSEVDGLECSSSSCAANARELRRNEEVILKAGLAQMEEQRQNLLVVPSVVSYLASMQPMHEGEDEPNQDAIEEEFG